MTDILNIYFAGVFAAAISMVVVKVPNAAGSGKR